MADAAEWGPDPERDDQEGSWDGDTRTPEPGPDWVDADLDRPPDHVPQLHRAMSEAAADLEAVDGRLSMLFDRTDDPGPGPATRPAPIETRPAPIEQSRPHPEFVSDTGTDVAAAPAAAADPHDAVGGDEDDDVFDLFEDGEAEEADDDVGMAEPVVADRMAIIGEYEDDIGGDFAALDAELAAEAPDGPVEPKRRMFRRRPKGTTAAQR